MANLTTTDNATAPASVASKYAYPETYARQLDFATEAEIGAGLSHGLWESTQRFQANFGEAKTRKANFLARWDAIRRPPPDDQVAEHDAEIEAAQRALDENRLRETAQNRKNAVARRVARGGILLMREYARLGVPEKFAKVPPIRNPAAELKSAKSAVTKLKGEHETVAEAPVPADETVAVLTADVDARAAKAMPGISLAGRTSSLVFPVVGIAAEPSGSGLPHTADAAAFFCAVARDRLVAHVKAKVAERYRSIPLALTRPEKTKRLAEIDAELLDAEYVECAAIRALKAQGVDVDFRPDADIRAVYGVRGPKVSVPD